MSTNESVVMQESLRQFEEAFKRGIDGIVQAAGIYVKALDENPANAEKFREFFADSIPASAWSNFEAIGRKWMHPQLLMGGMVDRKKAAIVKRLPYDVQEEVFNHKRFPLLLPTGETLKVSVQDAAPEQVEQLFDGASMRTDAAQKAYLENLKTRKHVEKSEELPYTIRDGKVIFKRGTILTKSEVRRILSEM